MALALLLSAAAWRAERTLQRRGRTTRGARKHNDGMHSPASSAARFLTLAQAAELLTLEIDEVLALLHEGSLRGVQLGTNAQWRV